jgi:hypothetical protein
MLNPTSIMAAHFGDHLSHLYLQYFSHRQPEYAAYLGGAARLVLERIGNSDALYHNVENTMMVTLVDSRSCGAACYPRPSPRRIGYTTAVRCSSTTSVTFGASARVMEPRT